MLENRGIAFKLVLLFTASSGLIFILVFGYSYWVSRGMIEQKVQENTEQILTGAVYRIESVLRPAEGAAKGLADFMENGTYEERELLQVIYGLLDKNPDIHGVGVAFEPYRFEKSVERFEPYFYRVDGTINFRYSNRHDNYLLQDWYQIPKELGSSQWAEPYFAEDGDIIMSAYSVPFYRKANGKSEVVGVVTVDISLDWLCQIVSSVKILRTGYGFLISKNGTIVTHPMKELIMNETIFGVAERRNDRALRETGRKMTRGASGRAPFESIDTGEPCRLYYAPITSAGWSLAVVFPQNELTEDIRRLHGTVIFLAMLGLGFLSFAIVLIARSITRPLREMANATKDIGSGNLDIELPPVRSHDEVGKLTEAFGYMKRSLKEYIRELTETTASKERIENELKIAHDIQMSILPKMFPPFPERREFDIYATIKPAKEVGGDFYDFFFIDDEHLCFVIADVSGKGIPASLFMAVTKTLIKAKAAKGSLPSDILSEVNNELCIGNDNTMFVTVFCGILDIHSGKVFYSNGGHNPPLLVRKDGNIAFLGTSNGVMLGVLEGFEYKTESLVLEQGDTLFLYTDGVNEAMNSQQELFSEQRLMEELIGCQNRSTKNTVELVMGKLSEFSSGADQSDDITILVMRFTRGQEHD